MMTKLESTFSGLLIVLLFLVAHELTITFPSKPKTEYIPGPGLEVTSTAIVHLPEEVRSTPAYHSTVPVNQRAESAYEPTSPDTESYSTDTTEVATPVILAALPEGLLTTQEQAAAFDDLRQQFLEAMSTGAPDPASPEYRRRWQEEQELLDEQFAALFGVEAFNQQQIAAAYAATR